jgi:hypothetical protein
VVDLGTWEHLSKSEQSEYQSLSGSFIKAVLSSDTFDGWDFSQKYKVVSGGEYFFLTNNSEAFAGIKSRSIKVIDALLADAIQNYGR